MAAPSALFPGVVIILDFVIPSLHGTIYQFFVFPGIQFNFFQFNFFGFVSKAKFSPLPFIWCSNLQLFIQFAASLLSWSSHTLKHIASNKRFLLVDKKNK